MSRRRKTLTILSLIALLIGVAPIISVVIAGTLANAHGCQLDEGSVHPCMIAGTDWGETLYTMAVAGWFMLVTLPLALGGAGVLAVLVLSSLWRAVRRRA